MTEVNAFILQNAFLFDQQDQDLSNQYMHYLKELTQIVQQYADDIPQLKYGWEITAPLDMEAIQEFETEQQEVVAQVNAIRDQILQKCKSKISA